MPINDQRTSSDLFPVAGLCTSSSRLGYGAVFWSPQDFLATCRLSWQRTSKRLEGGARCSSSSAQRALAFGLLIPGNDEWECYRGAHAGGDPSDRVCAAGLAAQRPDRSA